MRPILALLAALAAVLLVAAPALAAGRDVDDRRISVWCSVDDRTARADVVGIVTVGDDSHGALTLRLLGSKDHEGRGSSWQATGRTLVIPIVRGQTSYHFHFDVTVDSAHFLAYRVAGQADDLSRVIDRDECGFRVPEAPSSSLLALGGILPVGAWLGLRRLGLSLPHLLHL